jgi:type VI secretion system protein ImpC
MLEATESGPVKPARRPDELRAFIERAVAPHLTPKEDPRVPKLQAAVDEETGKVMRAILHHPDYQALEAAWRGVFFLIQGLETGTQLKLHLLDLSKAELAASAGKLHRLLVEDTSIPGAEPWAVVAGNFAFSRREADVALLGGLARIMQAAGAPFLAECDPAGDADSQEAARMWSALRHSPEAAWIGLALPRFLLRLPYGKNTDRLESFAFEEMPGKPEHGRYLWGNPAFACVYLLGQAFSSRGWEMRPGLFQELRGLPLHAYEADGEQRLQPCAETWMTEKDADWIMEQGFMPLASIKNQDAVRLVRFQSIADPPRALAGRWGG